MCHCPTYAPTIITQSMDSLENVRLKYGRLADWSMFVCSLQRVDVRCVGIEG